MGFFKKFLSLGSRRSKKRRSALTFETRPNAPLTSREEARRQQEEQEEIANLLLRSSSLRYAVVNEVDYSRLPPLPHPVNSLSKMPEAPPSRSASVQTRRTYTVTIRDRKVEACTEFPNANPSLDTPTPPSHHPDDQSGQISTLQPVTPKDQNRLRMLKQDPSVASLLDMYDNKGRLDINVFSNTPSAVEKETSKDDRVQLKRGGSTLRQLLGNPELTNCSGSTEGDISWAEGVLREGELDDQQSTSPASSFRLETPTDLVLGDDAFCEGDPGTTLPDSLNPESNLKTHTAISSMTVEPGYSSYNPALVARHTTEPELRPATEVFGFLLGKRRSRRSISMNTGRPSTAPSTPWDLKSSKSQMYDVQATPFSTRQSSPNSSDLQPVGVSASADSPSTVGSILVDPPHTAAILNHTRIPVAHGRLCGEGSRVGQHTATGVTTRASRIPRGRHSLQLDTWTPTSEIYVPTTAPAEPIKPSLAPACRSDALCRATNAIKRPSVVTTFVPPKQDASFSQVPMRSTHRRSVSHGSSRPPSTYRDMGFDTTRMARVKGSKLASGNKENILSDVGNAGMHSSRNSKSRLPMTPSREWALLSAPSPASSSELSPVGQNMMAELRKVRQARNERRTNRFTEAAVAHV